MSQEYPAVYWPEKRDSAKPKMTDILWVITLWLNTLCARSQIWRGWWGWGGEYNCSSDAVKICSVTSDCPPPSWTLHFKSPFPHEALTVINKGVSSPFPFAACTQLTFTHICFYAAMLSRSLTTVGSSLHNRDHSDGWAGVWRDLWKELCILLMKSDRSPKSPGERQERWKPQTAKVIIRTNLTAHFLTFPGIKCCIALHVAYTVDVTGISKLHHKKCYNYNLGTVFLVQLLYTNTHLHVSIGSH